MKKLHLDSAKVEYFCWSSLKRQVLIESMCISAKKLVQAARTVFFSFTGYREVGEGEAKQDGSCWNTRAPFCHHFHNFFFKQNLFLEKKRTGFPRNSSLSHTVIQHRQHLRKAWPPLKSETLLAMYLPATPTVRPRLWIMDWQGCHWTQGLLIFYQWPCEGPASHALGKWVF